MFFCTVTIVLQLKPCNCSSVSIGALSSDQSLWHGKAIYCTHECVLNIYPI